ncbi:MAG: hypothetical protein A2402_02480 [Candidatus Staskawiczbacteria bacterium RIFOXYC1_FULL_37_43]|nr:MAG: hypothetical protein A2813_03890 [Candidatus Staskawiczbacteria bacterium RIFCSPHIGHO2_01_FULL_37_17]OGZ71761.1 MAG: hypothetical protein A2891_00450 [Candidatus Staskawiczbacteria bacterium RIFCSPLOWO2_01_FULL_37_19]OGZ75847.1 MAG: hypothetical protein A2205_02005 [Candidatus Staskawiczbacteria bacterium RIFOXYA1_FULL_37_15]OGZ77261.1 MAG: hypothetical protein A2280_02490 [Candidatus Staskawiczbacteria bacterium RIFOXYA12_FULL_37_10]OGZ80217.1 MAG: hypothetical protein A2353_04075 [Can
MLKQQIQQDSTEALKSGEQLMLSVLRMLLAAIVTKEKEKRFKLSKDPASAEASASEESLVDASQLTDEEIVDVISSEIKKRRDAIVLYEKGGRQELADKEKKEIEVLQKYLPEQLSEEEIKKLIEESIAKTGAKEMRDMGKVMADLNPKIKGKADSGEVSKIVKELLSK